MTLNKRYFDNVASFVDGVSASNVIRFDITKPNGITTLSISGNLSSNNIKVGTGNPSGSVSGVIGTLYQRTDGASGTTLYTKEVGSGNTGWVPVIARDMNLYTTRTETAAVSAGLQLSKIATTTVSAISANLQLIKSATTTSGAISAGFQLSKAASSTVAAISANLQNVNTSNVTTAAISAYIDSLIVPLTGGTFVFPTGVVKAVSGAQDIVLSGTNVKKPIMSVSPNARTDDPWFKKTFTYDQFFGQEDISAATLRAFIVPAGQILLQAAVVVRQPFRGTGSLTACFLTLGTQPGGSSSDAGLNVLDVYTPDHGVNNIYQGTNNTFGAFSTSHLTQYYWRMSCGVAIDTNLTSGIIDLYYRTSIFDSTVEAPIITSTLSVSAEEGIPFYYTITATGATPITYSSEDLPDWATIDSTTGVISGTPNVHGTFQFYITATNIASEDSQTLTIDIAPEFGNLSFIRTDGSVTAMKKVGNILYIGGNFINVTDGNGTYSRNRAAAINLTSGLFESWSPDVNNSIKAFEYDGTYIYMVGDFTSVNSTTRNYAARVHPTTAVLNSWDPDFDSVCRDIKLINSYIYIAGTFSNAGGSAQQRVAKYDPSTGTKQSWVPNGNAGGGGPRYLTPGVTSSNSVESIISVGGNIGLLGMCIQKADGFYYGIVFNVVDATTGQAQSMTNGINDQTPRGMAYANGQYYLGAQFGFSSVVLNSDGSIVNFYPNGRCLTMDSGGNYGTAWNPVFSNFDTDRVLCVLADGDDIFIGGGFTELNGDTAVRFFTKTNSSGSKVSGFNTVFGGSLGTDYTYCMESCGQALAIGYNNTRTVNGEPRAYIAFVRKSDGGNY
jgi:hypothetical protein